MRVGHIFTSFLFRFMATQHDGSHMGSGHLLDPRADLASDSPAERRTRMTSHSSNKEALQDLQQVHDNLVIENIEKPVLSREGTIESESEFPKIEQSDDTQLEGADEIQAEDDEPVRRLSESSTGENAMKLRLGSRKKTQKRVTKNRLRHASSGGSSTELRNSRKPTRNRLGVYRSMRYRKRTESTKSAEIANENENYRKKHKSQDDQDLEVDQDEIYDEFDLLAEMKVPKRSRATSGSGPGYLRSLSDVVHHVGVPTTTTGKYFTSQSFN